MGESARGANGSRNGGHSVAFVNAEVAMLQKRSLGSVAWLQRAKPIVGAFLLVGALVGAFATVGALVWNLKGEFASATEIKESEIRLRAVEEARTRTDTLLGTLLKTQEEIRAEQTKQRDVLADILRSVRPRRD